MEMETSRAAFYGLLNKAANDLQNVIRERLLDAYAPFREMFSAMMMNEVKMKHQK